MGKIWSSKFLMLIGCVVLAASGVFAQNSVAPPTKSREVSDDGIPVLTKHLPDWENTRNRATYILDQNDMRNALGNRPVLDLINFASGTEAVVAPYEQGKLLLVEFSNPQASSDADEKIKRNLAETGQSAAIFYRRIGNYNAFFFDSTDESAANELFDQIKYEKNVQWLGEDPFYIKRAEHAMVNAWTEVFIATTFTIVGGLGFAILAGIGVGFLFYRSRTRRRAGMEAFSDAGGMTRLNLDGLTPAPDRLLNE
ncbi:MAG: hypothetical protein M3T96_00820 [Acidobacteriota bacterium]|nr:hypothetical protein [Acidobacteriota bacterium]